MTAARLDEMEREAFINGDTGLAALLADLEATETKSDTLEEQLTAARSEVERLTGKAEEYETGLREVSLALAGWRGPLTKAHRSAFVEAIHRFTATPEAISLWRELDAIK